MDKLKIICNNLRFIFPLISILIMNSISHISLPVSMAGIHLCSSKPSVSNGQAQSIHYGAFIPRMMEMTGHKNTVENVGSKNVHNTTAVLWIGINIQKLYNTKD